MPYHARTASASRLTALAIIAVIIGLLLSALGPVMQASAAPVAAGFKDHSYGAGVVAPTEDKPQSKVWFADGFWWAGMFVDGSEDYRIHKYNASTHVWTATSTILDTRNSSHGDYLWDGATNTLYVASVNADLDVAPILVFKLNYNPTTDSYAHDAAFTSAGITVGTGPAETVTIAKELDQRAAMGHLPEPGRSIGCHHHRPQGHGQHQLADQPGQLGDGVPGGHRHRPG